MPPQKKRSRKAAAFSLEGFKTLSRPQPELKPFVESLKTHGSVHGARIPDPSTGHPLLPPHKKEAPFCRVFFEVGVPSKRVPVWL